MRICVLGNSHVASLKLGLEKIAKAGRPELVFFASRANSLAALRLDGRRLVAPHENLAKALRHTSGGADAVDLDHYDAFLVYGLGFRLPGLQRSLSSAVQRQACRDTAEQTLSHRICSQLRKGTPKPVYVGHDPQEAAKRGVSASAEHLPYDSVFDMTAGELMRDKVQLVRQPRQTFADAWFTRQEFSAGSIRLDIGDEMSNQLHPEEDNKHMNAEFGRLWLADFFSGPLRSGAT